MAVVLFKWGEASRMGGDKWSISASSFQSDARMYHIESQQWYLPRVTGFTHATARKAWVPAGDDEVTSEQKLTALLLS